VQKLALRASCLLSAHLEPRWPLSRAVGTGEFYVSLAPHTSVSLRRVSRLCPKSMRGRTTVIPYRAADVALGRLRGVRFDPALLRSARPTRPLQLPPEQPSDDGA
jgi:hypothetical protein